MKNIAIILAAGSGRRMGTDVAKQFIKVRGRMVIEYAIEAFDTCDCIDEVAVVVSADNVPFIQQLVEESRWKKVRRVLAGGKERYDSSLAAIRAYSSEECNLIFHDAARPLVTQRIIKDVVTELRTHQAVAVAQPSVDTIFEVHDGVITSIPDRTCLLRAQTPQGFRLNLIFDAYRIGLSDPDFRATDDCGILLRYRPDIPIHIVHGDEACMKVTYREDVEKLEIYLKKD